MKISCSTLLLPGKLSVLTWLMIAIAVKAVMASNSETCNKKKVFQI